MSGAYLYSVSYISSSINAHRASVSIVALSIFDLAINLDIEIKYMRNLKFGILKLSFILCRILPLVLGAIRVAEDQTTLGAPEKCPIIIQAFNSLPY